MQGEPGVVFAHRLKLHQGELFQYSNDFEPGLEPGSDKKAENLKWPVSQA
jgi:hypothetical protein